ncbi:MAG: Lrp/AsnC ligand binding domain-containing protein [Methanothrix sp.]|nr:Lrp/AsnC ligand binding domain-containing protein [Methanothrix sp.]
MLIQPGRAGSVMAVVLVRAVPYNERAAYYALSRLRGAERIYHIFGEYDFLMMLEAEDPESLNEVLSEIEGLGCVSAAKEVLAGWNPQMPKGMPV